MTVLRPLLLTLLFIAVPMILARGEDSDSTPPKWIHGKAAMFFGFSKDRSTAFVYSSETSRFVTVSASDGFDKSVLPTGQGELCVFQTSDAVYAINAYASEWAVLPNPNHAKVELNMSDSMLVAAFDGLIFVYGRKATEWSGISHSTGKLIERTANGG